MRAWSVGDRVANRVECAHLYSDCEWGEKLSKPRLGTVIEVPLATASEPSGEGTILIEWDSLTGAKSDPQKWQKWLHTSLIKATTPSP